MNESNRRDFLKSSGRVVMAAGATFAAHREIAWAADANVQPWYRNAWRRAVIDMHIPDWDEAFLSKFDPQEYAQMLERSRAQSIVCYCQSHVGLFNYPTKVGKQHEAFRGRNVLQEMIDACHKREIAVVLYCSLIFDRWCGDTHPEWRMRRPDGEIHGLGDRHCVMCVNSPYQNYVEEFTTEICENFDFEGIRFDMTFWPWLCYCEYCQQRYEHEVGGEIPKTIDWLDERWVGFQRMRERSLVDFAEVATSTVKRIKPSASVEHQSSTYPLNWMFGVTEPLAKQNDFLQGDFYGDQLQGSFVRKLLERLTPNRPFGYETSFSRELKDHTSMKSEALLEAKASAAIADSAAFIFIDAIDPIGTVNYRAHDRMGKVFDRLMPCYKHLGGERVEDVAIFYSLESKFSMQGNGKPVTSPDTSDTHTETSMQVASRLIRSHIPFGVVTKSSLDQLDNIKVLILSNVHMMDSEECDLIRRWVKRGGKLIATGGTSLVDKLGRQQPDFMLSDVLGVSIVAADWSNRKHYVAPLEGGEAILPEFSAKYPAFSEGQYFRVKAHDESKVLATTVLPWPRDDGSKFSSIHSDPPWQPSSDPEITRHAFGKGEAIYCNTLIERMENAESALVSLVRMLNDSYRFEVEAPASVEVTMFRQPDRNRYLLSLLNFQQELPNVPVEGIRCRLNVDESLRAVNELTAAAPIPFQRTESGIEFTAPRLETLLQCEAVWS
jgi:hypothetical protein